MSGALKLPMTPKMAKAGQAQLIDLGYEDATITDAQVTFLAMMEAAPDGTLYRIVGGKVERVEADVVGAIQDVCWFDWSDNDPDAVAAIERLRAALKALGAS